MPHVLEQIDASAAFLFFFWIFTQISISPQCKTVGFFLNSLNELNSQKYPDFKIVESCSLIVNYWTISE